MWPLCRVSIRMVERRIEQGIMASERKLAANQRNAQHSTGPRNTARIRGNAFRHGILSSEALIRSGEGREDSEMFEELGKKFREDLNPIGCLEELLVDKLVMLV